MAILNIGKAREWLGARLGRRGPVSERTWKAMCDQGLPVGTAGESPIVSTDALEQWLVQRAEQSIATKSTVAVMEAPPLTKRKRGRPRKNRTPP